MAKSHNSKGAPVVQGPPPMLSAADLARRWQVSEGTLRNWRWAGRGCPFVKVGSRVLYRIDDVLAYEAEHLRGGVCRLREG